MARYKYTNTVNGETVELIRDESAGEPTEQDWISEYNRLQIRPDVTAPAPPDPSQGESAADVLKGALVDPLLRAGSMFVRGPGEGRAPMSPREMEVGARADAAARRPPALAPAPAPAPVPRRPELVRAPILGGPSVAYAPTFEDTHLYKGMSAVSPKFLQDIGADVGDVVTGETESIAGLRSPLIRSLTEIAQYTARDMDEEERRARDWARGDVPQPGEGIASNLVLSNPILPKQHAARMGIVVPPEEESAFQESKEMAATAVGNIAGMVMGAGESVGSDIHDYKQEVMMNFARMARQEALRARKRGDERFRMPFTGFMFPTEVVLQGHSDEQAAKDWARTAQLQSSIEDASDVAKDRLKDKLAESPGLFTWHTIKNWREAVGEMASSVGSLLLYGGGMTGAPEEYALDARGRYRIKPEDFADTVAAAYASSKLMGGQLAPDAVAGFATNIHPDTMASALEVDGPVALLDVMPFLLYAKAAAAAGKVRLPASAVKKIEYLEHLVEPMRDKLATVTEPVQRLLGEAGANRDSLMTDAYDTITRQTREEQAAIDSALKQIAGMVDEGVELGLRDPEAPAVVVRTPEGERLELMPSEEKAFESMVEERVRTQVEEAGGMVTPEIIPDEVRRVANERTFDEGAITDSVRGREIMREELDKYESEFGKPTRDVEVPGTKGKKGAKAEVATLDEQQSALWDKVNAKYDALTERVRKRAKHIDRAYKSKARAKTAKEDLGKEVGRLEAQRRDELRAVVERLHDDLSSKFEAKRDRTARLEEEAKVESAREIISRRSAWGISGKGEGAKRVPIGTNVWTAAVDVFPEEGSVSFKTPSAADIEMHGRRIDKMDISDQKKVELKDQYQRHGRYRGEEFVGEGKPVITPRIDAAPEITGVIDRIVEVIGKDDADKFRLYNEIEANIARSIDQQLPEFLRSETARKRLAQELVGAIQKRISKRGPLDKATRTSLVDSVYQLLNEVGSGKTPEAGQPGSALPLNLDFIIRHANGQESRINMLDEVASLVMRDKAKAKAIAVESIVQTARRQSIRRSQKSMQGAYVELLDPAYDYITEVSKQTGSPTDAPHGKSEAYRAVASQLGKESLPPVLTVRPSEVRRAVDFILDDPKQMAELKKFMGRSKEKGGVGRQVTDKEIKRALDRTARRSESYVDISGKGYDHLRTMLRAGDDIYDASRVALEAGGDAKRLAKARRTVDISAVPLTGKVRPGAVYMQKSLAKALNTYGASVSAAKQADMLMRGTVFAKTNMTARQLTTLKNNVVSNVILQTIRRGDPLVIGKLVKDFLKFKMFERGGKGLSKADIEMFQSLSDSGKIETSFVDAEITALSRSGLLDDLAKQGKIGPKWKKFADAVVYPLKKIESIYKYSDEMFKIEEGVRSYKQIKRWLDTLEEGESITLRLGPVKKAKLVKVGDGAFELGGKPVSHAKLQSIIGKAAMTVGEDLFFNYFDVGDLARLARQTSFFALASPFYTWFSKAMDIPLVKRGLLSEVYRGSPWVDTNNAKIRLELAADQARIGGAMDVAAAYSNQGDFDEEEMRVLRKTMGWGRGVQMGVFNAKAYSDLVGGYASLNQANPWGPTDIIFRAIENAAGILRTTGLSQLFGSDAADWAEAYRRDGKLDFGLEGASPEERKSAMDIRKFLMSRTAGETGITLADSLDLIGLAGHPFQEVLYLAQEAEKRDKDVSWAGFAWRFANMMIGGTYAKAADVAGAAVGAESLTTRYKGMDPIHGEEEEFIAGAIRKITGLGWHPMNVQKRGAKYFDRLERRWEDALIDPISKEIRDLEKKLYSKTDPPEGGRKKSLDGQIMNALNRKSEMQHIISTEVGEMRESHRKIIDQMKALSKKRGERAIRKMPGRAGDLSVIKDGS